MARDGTPFHAALRMQQAGSTKTDETARVAREEMNELTYHTPYRRRRRPFAAGASVAEACAAACSVDENDGNCQ